MAGAEGRPKPKSIRGDRWRGKVRRSVPREERAEDGQSAAPGSPWKSETRRLRLREAIEEDQGEAGQ